MKRLCLIVLLYLTAGVTHATFELEDPAVNVYEGMPDKTDGESSTQKTPPHPASGAGKTNIISSGIGRTACSDFLTNAAERSRLYWSGLYFIQGFIDGAAYQQLRTVGEYGLGSGHEAKTIELWIGDYCREHPGENLAQAAGAFVEARS